MLYAFHVKHPHAECVCVTSSTSELRALAGLREAWGIMANVRRLEDQELTDMTQAGMSVYLQEPLS